MESSKTYATNNVLSFNLLRIVIKRSG